MPRQIPPILFETLEPRRLFAAGPACPIAPAAAAMRTAFTVGTEKTSEITLGTPQNCTLILNGGSPVFQSHTGDTPSNGSESGCTIVLNGGTHSQTTAGGILNLGNSSGSGSTIEGTGSLTLGGAGFTSNSFINPGLFFGSNSYGGVNYGPPPSIVLIHASASTYSGTYLSAGALSGALVFNQPLLLATPPSNITITLLTGETLSFSQVTSLIIPPATGVPINGTPIPVIVNGSSGILTITPPSAVVDPATTPLV